MLKPISKGGDTSSVKNYHPMSFLSSLGKVLEIAVAKRVLTYCHCFKMFSQSHGFLHGRCVDKAIFEFVQVIISSLENKSLALGIFVDLLKAFDCRDQELFARNLQSYDFKSFPLD